MNSRDEVKLLIESMTIKPVARKVESDWYYELLVPRTKWSKRWCPVYDAPEKPKKNQVEITDL